MNDRVNRKWVVASRPEIEVEPENFELTEEALPALEPGQLLLKTRYLTLNPPMRMALVSGGIAGRPIGICGQAPSDYPEVAERLVRAGIDSLSLSPDVAVATRLRIAELEAAAKDS